MNLNQAIQYLSQILFQGRITMPNGPLTLQEHQELSNNFNFLVTRAQKAEEYEQESKAKPEIPPAPDEIPVEEEPIPVDKIEEDQDDSRTD